MTQSGGELETKIRQRFGWWPYRVLSGLTLFSCAVVLACDVLMWFLVEGYNPLSQTISELAAGPHHEIQDTGIVIFVLGILCLAGGLLLRGDAGLLPWIVRGLFVLLAVDIALIALWNEYGDGNPGGLVIHRYLLMGLYALVAAVLWLGTSVSPVRGHSLAKVGKIAAVAWVILAPLFYVVPPGIEGLYERILGVFLVGVVAAAALQLYERPRDQ